MKRLVLSVLCAALMIRILFAFAGCSVSERYVLKSLSYEGLTVEAEKNVDGEEFYVDLRNDGTAVLRLEGDAIDMKWDESHIWAAGEEDAKAELTIDGNQLTIKIEETLMTFEKK